MPSISYEFVASGHDAVRRAYLSIAEAEEKAAAASARASARVSDALKGLAKTKLPSSPVARTEAAGVAAARDRIAQESRDRLRSIREEERARVQSARRIAQEEARHKRDMERIDRESDRRFEKAQAAREKAAAREAESKQASYLASKREKSSTSSGAMKEFFGSMLAMRAYDKLMGTVESAARESIALQESTNRLSINARGAGEEFVDPTVLRKEFEQAAVATPGQNAQQIAEAIQSFVSLTGELKTGRESAQSFATVASATGSSVGDVSQAAASIYNQFGLKTKAEMQDVLASLTFQGKKGAFELRDAASQFQRLAAAGASFGLSGAKGVKTIGGLAQIARQGTGSAEQTTTAIENIFSGLIAKSKILKGQGVNVYDKKGRTREVTDVLIEAIAKLGKGNFEKKNALMLQVFGEGPGARGMKPLLSKYQVAYQEAQKNGATQTEAMAAGMKKLREVLDDSINAPGAWAEVQRDAARAQKDISAQTSVAWERVKQATADKLLPALEKAAPKLMELFLGENGELGPAMMAVSGFADGIGLAADAVGKFVDSLYATGILKRKVKSPAEQLEEEKKKLAAFDDETGDIYRPEFADQNAAANLDPNKVAARAAMVANIANIEDKVWTPSGEKTVDLTHDEFVKRYAELGAQGGDASDWAGSEAYQRRVGQIASSLESNPQYDFEAFGDTKIGSDASDAQKRLVEDYRAQQFLGGGKAGKISSDMAILASSAQTAAKALQLIGASQQASITGVSGPSAGGPG